MLLYPLSAMASQSSKPTEDTMKKTLQFLNYAATQEKAVRTYSASKMKLAAHSNVSCITNLKYAAAQAAISSHQVTPQCNTTQ
jgi:hypothetical protein